MRPRALGYVGFRASDLSEWRAYGTRHLGFQVVDRSGDSVAFRMDDRRQRVVVEADGGHGPNRGINFLGWEVEVSGQEVTFTDRSRHELPAPPAMPVLLERRDGVAIITLNRPERRNAIDLATAELLEQVVDLVESDDSIRVAILTGAGGTFSAGMDLKAAAQGSFAMTERGGPLGIAARRVEKPLIAP